MQVAPHHLPLINAQLTRRLVAAALLLSFAATAGAKDAESQFDWLRGAGNDLQMRLRGEIANADGSAAADARLTCSVNRASGAEHQHITAAADGRFEIWIPVNGSLWPALSITASGAHSNHIAYVQLSPENLRQTAIDGVHLTLQPPARRVQVTVLDEGEPVASAKVKADLGYGIEQISETDISGIAPFNLLAEHELSRLTAWTTDHRVGGYNFDREPIRDATSEEHVIELSKCRDQIVRFVDEQQAPVAGVDFVLQIATPPPSYNYIGLTEFSRIKTGANGEAVLRWFPDWKEVHYYPELRSSGWVLNGDPKTVDGVAEFKLKKRIPRKTVTGRVVSDSTSTAGFFVQVQSFQGEQERHSDHLQTFADADGNFAVDVLPDACYCAYVLDKQWVGKIIDLIPYAAATDQINSPVLSVERGQEVEITATIGQQRRPYAHLGISLSREHSYSWQENGKERHGTGGPQWWVKTDGNGKTKVRAIPGTLKASVYEPTWRTEQTAFIHQDEPFEIELHREFENSRVVQGRVVLADGVNAPVQGAIVRIGSVDGHYKDRQTVECDEQGRFSCEIMSMEIALYCVTPDGSAAGTAVVRNLNAPIKLELRPTVDFEGQLRDADDKPVANQSIQAEIRIEGQKKFNAALATVFWPQTLFAQTDENGNYTLHGVPDKTKLDIYVPETDDSKQIKHLSTAVLKPGAPRARKISRLPKQ